MFITKEKRENLQAKPTLSKLGIQTVNMITQQRYLADQTKANANWIGNKRRLLGGSVVYQSRAHKETNSCICFHEGR